MTLLKRLSPRARIALAAVLGVGLFLLYRARAAAPAATIDGSLVPTGTLDPTASFPGTGGTGTTSDSSAAILEGLQQQGEVLTALSSRLEDLGTSLSDLPTTIGDVFATAFPPTDESLPGLDPTDIFPPNVGPSGQYPPDAPGNARAAQGQGFWWTVNGKPTFVTDDNKGTFLAELHRHGTDVTSWALNHPAAASAIGVTVPSGPPPKSAPLTDGFWWNVDGKPTFVTSANRAAFLAELARHGVSAAAFAARHPSAGATIHLATPPKPQTKPTTKITPRASSWATAVIRAITRPNPSPVPIPRAPLRTLPPAHPAPAAHRPQSVPMGVWRAR